MKIFNFLTGKAGKLMLSTAQAIAASAAVGVGGIAAWQILGSGSDADTSFNALGYQPQEEVVYVSGAATGSYGKEEQTLSSFRAAPSKAIEMQQQEAEYQRQQKLAAEEAQRAALMKATQTPDVKGASVGGINEGLGNKKLEGMTPEQIKAMQQQAIQQAQQAVSAGKAQADALAAAASSGVNSAAARGTAGSSGLRGTMAGANLGGSGSAQYVGMPGSVNSGKNGGVSEVKVEDVRASGEGHEGANIPRARNLLSKPNFGASVQERADSKDFNSLELMAKRSAEIAGNTSRSANEAGRAFLASSQNSGGIRLEGAENVSTGQGASSDDFGDVSGVLSGLNASMDGLMDSEELFKEKRKELRKKLRQLIGWTFLAFVFAIPYLGWLAVRKHFNSYFSANDEYEEEYGYRSKEARAGKKIAKKLRACAKMGAAGAAVFSAMIPWMLADAFGWTTSAKELKKDDPSTEEASVGAVEGSTPQTGNSSTLDIKEGQSAQSVSSQEAQEHMASKEEGK